jgi:hypothetical protein
MNNTKQRKTLPTMEKIICVHTFAFTLSLPKHTTQARRLKDGSTRAVKRDSCKKTLQETKNGKINAKNAPPEK